MEYEQLRLFLSNEIGSIINLKVRIGEWRDSGDYISEHVYKKDDQFPYIWVVYETVKQFALK